MIVSEYHSLPWRPFVETSLAVVAASADRRAINIATNLF
jgi:hypothetical protein